MRWGQGEREEERKGEKEWEGLRKKSREKEILGMEGEISGKEGTLLGL